MDTYNIECYVYKSILVNISLRTPKLFYNTAIEDVGWLVLEDIGAFHADRNKAEHRIELLKMLGCLHGKGTKLLKDYIIKDNILPGFEYYEDEFNSKKSLLEYAINNKEFNIDDWVITFYEYLWNEFIRQDNTIIHGDTDFSNVIIDGDIFGLIDFEKCKIGPAIIDFSKISEYINNDEYEAYVKAFNKESGQNIKSEQVLHSAYLGEVYDSFHWICYDIKNVLNPSYPEYQFDRTAFGQKLDKLEKLFRII